MNSGSTACWVLFIPPANTFLLFVSYVLLIWMDFQCFVTALEFAANEFTGRPNENFRPFTWWKAACRSFETVALQVTWHSDWSRSPEVLWGVESKSHCFSPCIPTRARKYLRLIRPTKPFTNTSALKRRIKGGTCSIKENEGHFGSVTGFVIAVTWNEMILGDIHRPTCPFLHAVMEEEMMWLNLEVSSL